MPLREVRKLKAGPSDAARCLETGRWVLTAHSGLRLGRRLFLPVDTRQDRAVTAAHSGILKEIQFRIDDLVKA